MITIIKVFAVILFILAVCIIFGITILPFIVFIKGKKDNPDDTFLNFLMYYIEELGTTTIYMFAFSIILMMMSCVFLSLELS